MVRTTNLLKLEMMRKVFLMLTFVLQCIYLNAQMIDGVGKVRLGMTTAQMHELFGENLKSEKSNEGLVTSYIISKYTPAEGYDLIEFYLCFYNDSLFSMFTLEPSNIKEALTIKYGEPKLSSEEEVKTYTNGYGQKIEKVDKIFRLKWETGNPDIECEVTHDVTHDYYGVPKAHNSFGINDFRIVRLVDQKETEIKENKGKKERQEKLKALDGL